MNIFNIYLDKIIKIVTDQNKKNLLKLPKKLDSINVDIPPKQFDCDISTNVSMVLAKINETQPIELANKLVPLIKKEDSRISNIKVAKNLGLRGTPASIVNDTIFPGYVKLAKLKKIISQ